MTARRKEFAGHETIATDLEAGFYFAHPYSSWERGLNPAGLPGLAVDGTSRLVGTARDGGGTENTNGLIRQYFPKSRDFTTITDSDTQAVMDKLNNRPRKCLGFKHLIKYFSASNPMLHLEVEPRR